MVAITERIPLILVQIRLNNLRLVPADATWPRREKPRPTSTPKVAGIKVIDSVQDASIYGLVGDLEKLGYQLTWACCEEQAGRWLARFTFKQEPPAPGFDQDQARAHLLDFLSEALWAGEVWQNPFFHNGQVVPDQNMLCIDLAKRTPFIGGDGRPTTRRKPGAEQATPLEAAQELRITNLGVLRFCDPSPIKIPVLVK
jgi:hypothetical protein